MKVKEDRYNCDHYFPMEVDCSKCDSVLEIEGADDILYTVKPEGGNYRDTYDITVYYVKCPLCGGETSFPMKHFENNEMPIKIKQQIAKLENGGFK